MAPLPDRFGRYEVLGLLGEGGMGRVYLGRAPGGRLVAIKEIRPSGPDQAYRARFRREVRAATEVNSAYTAAVLAFDPAAPRPWLVTAYLPGLSLGEAVGGGRLPMTALRGLAAGLAEALAAIHDAGVVHGDLTPENVILTPDGPRVIDFGIARPAGAAIAGRTGASNRTGSNRTGSNRTWQYLSPEQRAGGPAAAPGDVFMLGAVLLFAATGRHPFPAGPLRGMPDLGCLTDRKLRAVVASCLARNPRRRPSAGRVLARLGGQVSLQGTGWLPAAIGHQVAARAAAASLRPLPVPPPVAELAAMSPVAELAPVVATTPPAEVGGGHPDPPGEPGRRWGRRAVLAAAIGVPAVVGVPAAVGVLAAGGPRGGRDADHPPAARPPARSPGRPVPVAGQRWSAWAGDGYPDLDVAGGLVLAWSATGVRALDPGNGRVRWKRSARQSGNGGSVAVRPGGGSTLRGTVASGMAYLIDGSIYPWALLALRVGSGGLAWRYGLDDFPGAVVGAGRDAHQRAGGVVRAVSAAGGHPRWSATVAAGRGLVAGQSLVAGHSLVAGGGALVAASRTALVGLDAGTGRRRWRYRLPGGAAPVLADGLVAVRDRAGAVHAVRIGDGSRAWRRSIGATGAMRYSAGALYAATGDGWVVALRAASGEPIWSARIGGPAGTLGRTGRTLLVGGADATVYALDAGSGRLRWTYGAAVTPTSPPVAAGGLVFVGTADGHVHALVPPTEGTSHDGP